MPSLFFLLEVKFFMVGKSVTKKQKIEIANLYMQGMTYIEIAAETNLSKSTVYRMIKNDFETRELLAEMERDYKNEVMDLCINEMKEILLDEKVGFPFTIDSFFVMVE